MTHPTMPRGQARAALLAAAALLALSGPVQAQAVRGTLLGTIVDTQSAAVPGVTVVATETQTNVARTAVTNPSGHYVFANMKDGLYRIETELSGFKKFSRDGVQVKVNSTVRVDIVLEVGAMTETVEVVQETPLLQTDRADTGRTIEGRQVQELPLSGGRNFQGMWATVPGTVTLSRPHSQFFNPQDSQETKFNGQSRLSNNVQIDGLDDNHKTGLLTVLIPSAESIDTVNVTTSNFDAEFGRAGGSVTTVVLKSGTNQVRGSVFAFGNTEATQARSYFASPTSKKPETKYQQFGATLGGPIVKDKLFFFTDYQRTVDNLGTAAPGGDPAHRVAQRRFLDGQDDHLRPCSPATRTGRGARRSPATSSRPNRISPVAQSILAEIPQPNIPGAALGQVNYELASSEREKTTNAVQRQAELQPHHERPDVAPLQLPAAGDLRPRHVRRARRRRRRLRRHRLPEHLQHRAHLDAHAQPEPDHGVARRLLEVSQRGASPRARASSSSTEVGIPGANYDDFSSGISRITHRQRLHGSARRVLGQPPVGPR